MTTDVFTLVLIAVALVTFLVSAVLMTFLMAVALMSLFMTVALVSLFVAVTLVTFLVSLAIASAVTTAVTTTVASAMASSFVRYELTMKSLCEFLLCSVPYRYDFAGEVQCLAGHRMVEVHSHDVFADGSHDSLNDHACAVEHRNDVADFEELFLNYTVYLERALRKVEFVLRIVFAITFFRGQCECEFASRLESFYFGLELRQKHMSTMNVVKWLCLSLVHNFSVYCELVGQLYNLIVLYFHIYRIFFDTNYKIT